MGVTRAILWLSLVLCAAAQAQPAFRAATQAAGTSATITHVGAGAFGQRTNCGSITPTIPAGNAGDGLLALVVARENGATITMPGWALLYSDTPAGQEYQALVFGRIADNADPNTVTQSGTCNTLIAQIARFDNLDPTTPLEPPGAAASYQNAGAVTSGSVTTTVPGSMLLAATFVMANRTVTQGAGWTQSIERATDPAGGGPDPAGISLNYQLQAGTGTFSFANWDLSGGGNSPNHGVLLALRPRQQLTLAVPPGTTVGDVMLATVAVRPSTVAITAPAGWTAVVETAQGAGTSSRQALFYRAVTGVEPASYTWTLSEAHTGAVGGIATYSGVDLANPIDVSGGNVTPSGTSHTANEVTTTVNNAMVVSTHSFTSAEPWTPPAGMSERVDVASLATPNGAGISLGLNDAVQAIAGATGDRTATVAGNADTGVAQIVALRPGQTILFDIIAGEYNLDCAAYPVEVTIVARDAATGNLASTFANLVNISTAPATGDWSAATAGGTLDNDVAGDGAATYQFVVADSGRIVLRLGTTTATSLTVAVQDTATGLSSTSATINFITDGYVIVPDPVQVAGRPQTITVQRRISPGCGLSGSAGHNGNNAVKLWLSLDPSHPAGATQPSAAGASNLNPVPTAEPGTNNITLSFAGGQATFTLNTTDVGKFRINVRDTNTTRRGSSPAITERPFALAFPGVQHGTDHNAAILAAAGDPFTLAITAYRWQGADDANDDGLPDAGADITDNGTTARYAWDTLLDEAAILPAGGAGVLSFAGASPLIPKASFAAGAASVNNAQFSEVGNVRVSALAEGYLDTPGVNVTGDSAFDGTGAAGGYVGRFRPKHFALDVSAGNEPTLANRAVLACASTFSYMDEGLRLTYQLIAQNAQNARTENYTGLYARHDPTSGGSNDPKAAFGLAARSGTTDLTSRVSAIYTAAPPAWLNGLLRLTASPSDTSVRATVGRATPDNPDGPYAGVAFGIAPVDPDGTAMNTLDLDVNNDASNDRKALGVSTEVRFGRLRLQNALGAQHVQLPVPLVAQYWNGSVFATNAADSCTSIPRSAIALDYTGSALAACASIVAQDPVTMTGGVATLRMTPPNARGQLLVRPNLGAAAGTACAPGAVAAGSAALPYLLGRWDDAADPDASASTSYDDSPSARATFGLYGSQPGNFIYFRENF